MNNDLVQRLRDIHHQEQLTRLGHEAADHIEYLQKFRDLYPEKVGKLLAALNRIVVLETALREIDKLYPVEQFGYATGFKAREIIRRALEGNPGSEPLSDYHQINL